MADTSGHYKQMEDLMGTEILMKLVKQGKFQCVNNAAHGVEDPSC